MSVRGFVRLAAGLAGSALIALPLPSVSPPSLSPQPAVSPVATPTVAVSPVAPSPVASAQPAPARSPARVPQGEGPSPLAAASPAPATPGVPVSLPLPVKVDLTQLPATVPIAPALLAVLILVLLLALVVAVRNVRYGRRMAAIERVKSDVLNLASHELRTPLTVVKGYLSMIQDGSLKPETPEFHAAFAVLTAKVRQIDRLVEEILQAARLEEARLGLVLDDADLRDIVSEAFHALAPQARGRHLLRLELAAGPIRVRADRVRIESVVAQLLDNAMKYSPEGGDVLCKVFRKEDRAMVMVRDSGLGIAEADIDKLFTRFGRVVTRENSHIYGTGLGLFLSREVARAHGGDLKVASKPGTVSTFSLTLPLVPAQAQAASEGSERRGVVID